MASDFDTIAQMGPPGSEDIPELQNLQQALGKMRDFQATLKVQSEQNEKVLPPQSIQVNTAKGTVTMKDLPIATYEAFNRDRAQLNEIRGAFHQESERLKNQEQQARNQPPWVQLATALSANLASQKDMPGWVRGLGQTAAQLNPRPEEIQARRLGVLQQEAGIAEKGANIELAQIREQRLQKYEDATLGMEHQKFARQIVQDKLKGEEKIHEKWDDLAAKGLFNPTTFAKELRAANPDIKDDEIKALVVGKQELAGQADVMREKLGAQKFAEFKREQEVKYQNDKKLAEQDHRAKMEEIVAKNRGTINPKTGKPFTQFELKEIAEMETTGILVGNLKRDLDEHPDLFGPMPQTRANTWIKSFFDEGVSRVRADYDHALPIMVKLLQEGTRGYARNQREWVESKVPRTTDTPERLKGKLAFLDGFLEARQKGLDAVFVAESMAREQQMKGQSPYPAPAASHGQDSDVWTPERVKAEREKQRGGR